MADAADLIMRASVQGGREAVDTLDDIAVSAAKAERSAESFGSGAAQMSAQLKQAEAALRVQNAALNDNVKAAGLSRHALMNLGYQVQDIGVQLAGGQNPFLIMAQQGSQIAQIYGGSGVGVGAALRQLLGILSRFGPAGAVIGTLAAGFALFEREVDKSTKGATTFGQTWQATLNVVGSMIMDGPIGDGLRWLGKAFGATLDAIVDGVMWWVDKVVGHFGAAYELIIKNWRRLPEVFGVIVQGAANIAIQAVEGLVNKTISGVNVLLRAAGKSTIGFVDLPEIRVANAKLTADYERMAKSIEGSFKRSREGVFTRIVRETEKVAAAQAKSAKATNDNTKATEAGTRADEEAARAKERLRQEAMGIVHAYETPYERAVRKARDEQIKLREALDAGVISAEQFREAIERQQGAVLLEKDLAKLPSMEDFRASGDAAADWSDALQEATDDAREAFDGLGDTILDVLDSLKSGDWTSAVRTLGASLSRMANGVQGTFSAILNKAGTALSAVGSAMGMGSVGAGAAQAMGFGNGSQASQLGGLAGGTLGWMGGSALGASFAGLAAWGGGSALLSTLGAVAGPIGMIAGAILGTVLGGALGGKPTNASGAADLTADGFRLVQNKRSTQETMTAAQAAAQSILAGQKILTDAGINLGARVTNVDIGTRDPSNIKLSNGRSFRTAAVGDPAEAAEKALMAVLETASYTHQTLKQLVESARAAGKSFDEIAVSVQRYQQAQNLPETLRKAILQLTDPKQYALSELAAAQKARRDEAQKMKDEGLGTAEWLAGVNAQLSQLEALELDEVLKQFATAAEVATDTLSASVQKAQSDFEAAFGARASELEEQGKALRSLAASLREYGDSLKVQYLNPRQGAAAAQAAFARLAGRTDQASMGQLQGAGQAYIEATRGSARSAIEVARAQAQVRAAVEHAAAAADSQASAAEQQLTELKSLGEQLGIVNKSILSLPEAIAALMNAQAAAGQPGLKLTDAAGRLVIDRDRGIGVDALGNPMPWARDALGLATGGSFDVAGGHSSGDRVPVSFWANAGESVSVSRSDNMDRVADALERQNNLLSEQNELLRDVKRDAKDTSDVLRRVSQGGDSLKTTAEAA